MLKNPYNYDTEIDMIPKTRQIHPITYFKQLENLAEAKLSLPQIKDSSVVKLS